ncbi:protein translocase subunit SecD [Streptomyces gobiensis]|uniref:protein translocase subunit SecD n=1 Tax=Streptomyces gobiensis TaxID=2875706 RepID=UPI001E48BFA3|nr:protein translocase subunit SecD [Streptomyces gobiensis]UGY90400.1 protein translocase subunit SecD [Streptomyces gobiensis]
MATPKRGRRSPGTPGKPWRPLTMIIVLMGVLVGGMFLAPSQTPRLGIDLAGGTSITLEAQDQPGKKSAINETNMNTAASIIERRVNGLGVAEAEVQTQGTRNIIVNIPRGTDEKQAREQVGSTAELGFRLVLAEAPATPAPARPDGAKDGGDKGDEKKGDKGDKTDSASSPSSEPTTQGRAATDALKANDDGTESPKPTGSPAPEEKQEDPTVPGQQGLPGDLGKQLEALDCSTKQARLEANRAAAQVDASDPIVACDRERPVKYALGKVEVPGTDVKGAAAVIDERSRQWIVQMDFNSRGAEKFADVTGQIAQLPPPQNQFAIVLDGEVVSAPSVQGRIPGGQAKIEGSFTQESASDLANVLKFGALPISFEEANVSSIGAALAGEQLKAGLIAGAIGLALVVLYLLFYYRALAAVAVASLMAMGGLTYTIMTLLGPGIGFALSLPAICGAIVAIGITADSFIVYFERIRDEVREGRSIRPAIERAWPRARRTILVSDVVSFLAAVVLFFAAVGTVQGFAFVLGLTTALDVVVVFLLTKPMTTLLAGRKFFADGHPWSGLSPKRLGARPPIRGSRRRSAPLSADPKEA